MLLTKSRTGSHMVPVLNGIGTDVACVGVRCHQSGLGEPKSNLLYRIMTWTSVYDSSDI